MLKLIFHVYPTSIRIESSALVNNSALSIFLLLLLLLLLLLILLLLLLFLFLLLLLLLLTLPSLQSSELLSYFSFSPLLPYHYH
jgi:hypothetical protein